MKNKTKYIFDFLTETDRSNLTTELDLLKAQTSNYYIVDSSTEMITNLRRLSTSCPEESFVIQIVSHGSGISFGSDNDNFVAYSEITDILRDINLRTNGGLILNLMTICFSIYELSFFNSSPIKLYSKLIGSIDAVGVQGSILQSIDVNNANILLLDTKIQELNENRRLDYDVDLTETYTYIIR